MLIGTTIFLTVVSALVLGILCGWAALSGILFFFSRERQLQPSGVLNSSAPASTPSA